MPIFYLLITLFSGVLFAADDQRAFSPSSSTSSSSSLNQVYSVPEKLQNSLNIFASHARDARFSSAQKAAYTLLELQFLPLMQMLNPNITPKPEIVHYKPIDRGR